MSDAAQDRYVAHQARKRQVLAEIMAERHSARRFANTPPAPEVVDEIVAATAWCPSSCDRHGVTASIITDRDRKALLNGVLVGGVGWVYRAPVVVLLFANPDAYKAPGELDWMPYLDAGAMVEAMYLAATAAGLSGCFINPNIREMNRAHFASVFGDGVFCGAFAMGMPYDGEGSA